MCVCLCVHVCVTAFAHYVNQYINYFVSVSYVSLSVLVSKGQCLYNTCIVSVVNLTHCLPTCALVSQCVCISVSVFGSVFVSVFVSVYSHKAVGVPDLPVGVDDLFLHPKAIATSPAHRVAQRHPCAEIHQQSTTRE